MACAPVIGALVRVSDAQDRYFIEGPADQLQADGQAGARESARDGHCRKPADIADAAERIRKSQIGLEIQRQRRCCNRLRQCCSQ